jgi:hypothetical protein
VRTGSIIDLFDKVSLGIVSRPKIDIKVRIRGKVVINGEEYENTVDNALRSDIGNELATGTAYIKTLNLIRLLDSSGAVKDTGTPTLSVSGNTITASVTITISSTYTLASVELGNLSGTTFTRYFYQSVSRQVYAGDQVTITWTITVSTSVSWSGVGVSTSISEYLSPYIIGRLRGTATTPYKINTFRTEQVDPNTGTVVIGFDISLSASFDSTAFKVTATGSGTVPGNMNATRSSVRYVPSSGSPYDFIVISYPNGFILYKDTTMNVTVTIQL